MTWQDTIAAIATPQGTGGIGIIRISGPLAEVIARRLFKPAAEIAAFESHRLYHGDIIAPGSGILLDEALLALMKKPHSYTGEDILEIYCHGGRLILQSVLREVIAAGCRPAAPGEFTKRAFLNDRLDLSQAEAISDLIMAQTEQGRQLALSHLKGCFSERINALRGEIIACLARLEAAIDFSEDEISLSPGERAPDRAMTERLRGIIEELQALLATYERGKILRDGASVVLAGRPNVGKSSLLNALLGERRAIVTPLPGTTRDFIEEAISIAGTPIKLIDTAGIRNPENIIEEEGIALVREKLSTADLVILILDGSSRLAEEDRVLLGELRGQRILVAVNKNDLPQALDMEELQELLPDVEALRISAKYGQGIDGLEAAIHRTVLGSPGEGGNDVMIANLRHKSALEKAVTFLCQAETGLLDNLPPELIAVDIGDALSSLGEILDKTTNEEVLAEIFANFCVGK